MEAESLSLKKLQDERLRLLASTFMEKYSNLQSSVLEKIVNLNNRTLEYDKLTVRFLLLLRECMCFIDIPNEFPSCLQEVLN